MRDYFGSLSDGQVPSPLHLIIRTRELLEFLDTSAYPVSRLYGNWAVHTQITGSPAGYALLGQINQQVIRTGILPAMLSQTLVGDLSTAELRRELRALFTNESIPAPFLESRRAWFDVLAGIFEEVRGKPIQFPNGQPTSWAQAPKVAQRTYDAARAAIVKKNGSTTELVRTFFIDVVHVPGVNEDPTQGLLRWNCGTEGGYLIQDTIHGKVFEARSAFAAD